MVRFFAILQQFPIVCFIIINFDTVRDEVMMAPTSPLTEEFTSDTE